MPSTHSRAARTWRIAEAWNWHSSPRLVGVYLAAKLDELKKPGGGGTTLTVDNVIQRIQTQTCAGCHQWSNGKPARRRRRQLAIVPAIRPSERAGSRDSRWGVERFRISETLKSPGFIPARCRIVGRTISAQTTRSAPTCNRSDWAAELKVPRPPFGASCGGYGERTSNTPIDFLLLFRCYKLTCVVRRSELSKSQLTWPRFLQVAGPHSIDRCSGDRRRRSDRRIGCAPGRLIPGRFALSCERDRLGHARGLASVVAGTWDRSAFPPALVRLKINQAGRCPS